MKHKKKSWLSAFDASQTTGIYTAILLVTAIMFFGAVVLHVAGSVPQARAFFGLSFSGPTTYYVDFTNGSDSANGTSTTTAWKHAPGDDLATGTAASTTLIAGDSVEFKGGTAYVGSIELKWSGTSENPITYRGSASWGSGKAIITNTNSATNANGLYTTTAKSNLVIDNFEFRDIGGYAAVPTGDCTVTIPSQPGAGISLKSGDSFITIKNSLFSEIGGWQNQSPFTANNIDGTGIALDNANTITIDTVEFTRMSVGVSIKATNGTIQNIEVKNSDFHNYLRWGIDVAVRSTNATIRGISIHDNKIHDYYEYDTGNWVGCGEKPHTDGIFMRVDYDGATWQNNKIFNNLFYTTDKGDSQGGTAQIYVTEGPTVDIYNNIFMNTAHGRTVYLNNGPRTGGSEQTVRIYNNSFFNDHTDISLQNDCDRNLGNVYIQNNIFYDTRSGSGSNYAIHIEKGTCLAREPAVLNNNVYRTQNTVNALIQWSGDKTLAQLQARGFELNGIQADPLYTTISYPPTNPAPNILSNNLHLQSGSPAISAGANLSATIGLLDKDGVARPSSGAWDIGAYEFTGTQSTSKTYYVATTGLDTNPGTAASPFRTIQKCANIAVAGDTCSVGAGTFNERVATINNGTSTSPITFVGNSSNVPGGFSIDTNYIIIKEFEIANGYSQYAIYVKGSYCQILDNYIHDSQTSTWDEIMFTWYAAVPIGCVIKGNRFSSSVAYGGDHPVITVWGNNHLIENNEIGPMLDIDAFRAFGSGDVIKNNYIHNIGLSAGSSAHGDVLQSFLSYGAVLQNFIFEKNTITDFNGQVFMIDGVLGPDTNITISNNTYSKVALQGQTYVPLKVYNNTFSYVGSGNGNAILFRKGASGDATGSTVRNNIFYNCGYSTSNTGWYATYEGATITADYSLVYPTKTGFSEAHGINGSDPLLTNALAHDLHLLQASPVVDKGTTISAIGTSDISGTIRPQGAAWDMGAYEYQSTTPTCTDFNYSDWSACTNNTQTRTVTGSAPANCTGGTPTTTQSCSTTQGTTGGTGGDNSSGGGSSSAGAPLTTPTTTSTIPACYNDNDCGTNEPLATPYCANNAVIQSYNRYTCANAGTPLAHCTSTITPQIITTCDSNSACLNGSCQIIQTNQTNEAAHNNTADTNTNLMVAITQNAISIGGVLIALILLGAGVLWAFKGMQQP